MSAPASIQEPKPAAAAAVPVLPHTRQRVVDLYGETQVATWEAEHDAKEKAGAPPAPQDLLSTYPPTKVETEQAQAIERVKEQHAREQTYLFELKEQLYALSGDGLQEASRLCAQEKARRCFCLHCCSCPK